MKYLFRIERDATISNISIVSVYTNACMYLMSIIFKNNTLFMRTSLILPCTPVFFSLRKPLSLHVYPMLHIPQNNIASRFPRPTLYFGTVIYKKMPKILTTYITVCYCYLPAPSVLGYLDRSQL